MTDFDKACTRWTMVCTDAANWKYNFLGAAYSTRLRASLNYLQTEIDALEAALIADGYQLAATPPPEPPLPWLAFDLEAMQRGVEWLRYCAGAEGVDSIALACHNVTLTTQLAEARGLLERASDALEYVLNNEDWDADAVETVANALMRYNDQPTSPQAALTALTGGE